MVQINRIYEKGNFSEKAKDLLIKFNNSKIIFGKHSPERMKRRQVNQEVVIKNLRKPDKLYETKKDMVSKKHEEKYKCYFRVSGQQIHIYILAFNFKHKFIKVVTVIKDRPQIQRRMRYEPKR